DEQALARIASLLGDEYEVVDHPNGVTYDLRGSLATWEGLLRVPGATSHHEPLATLGDSVALLKQSVSSSGLRRGRFDVGAYEQERIFLIETDSAGRRRRAEVFAVDRLGDAVAGLYARYAEHLPDGPERARAAATARLAAALTDAMNLVRSTTALAPTIE